MLGLFTSYMKYPRTHHLPWSYPSKDDKIMERLDLLVQEEVVVTVKMDGEQSNLYRDHFHARSLDFATGEDRARVKAIWGSICGDIPEGWRICGENVTAKHSIAYDNLESYFYLFGIWNENNECLSWDDTQEWAALLGVVTVPELYRGPFDEAKIKALYQPTYQGCEMEGYVVRAARSFTYAEFRHLVGKFVRLDHVRTKEFWRHARREWNTLKREM